jgi:hypothetical protein
MFASTCCDVRFPSIETPDVRSGGTPELHSAITRFHEHEPR